MVNTASPASNRHYREACTCCNDNDKDKDKEISRLNAEITKLTAAKSLSASASGKETEKMILGKLPQLVQTKMSESINKQQTPSKIQDIAFGIFVAFLQYWC